MIPSRPSTAVLLSVFGVLGMVSCVSEQAPPQLDSVSPERVYVADTTPIRIKGERFFPAVQMDLSRGGSAIDEGFELSFVHRESGHRVDVDAVAWDSFEQLSTVWPADEPTGDYDLELTAPDGQESTLESALSVSDSRASSIVVNTEGNSYLAGDLVRFDLALVDAQGEAVVEAGRVPITLRIEDAEAEDLLVADVQGLDGLLQVDDQVWATSLSPTGENWFKIGSTAPGLLTLVVSDDGEDLEDGEKSVLVEQGSVASLEVTLPGEGFQSIAGEAFPVEITPRDEEGNIVTNQEVTLALSDRCDGRVSPDYVTLSGKQTVTVSFFRATRAAGDCSETRLLVGGEGGSASESFVVRAAEASQLVLSLEQSAQATSTVAGDSIYLEVEALDAYSNRVRDFDLPLSFTSRTTGGELEGAAVEPRLEEVWLSGVSFWQWTPVVAGQAVLEASGGGLSTLSESLSISPGEAVDMDGNVDSALVVAGTPFTTWVALSDIYGNSVPVDPTQDSLLAEDDQGNLLSCTYSGGDEVRTDFDCLATRSSSGTSLDLSLNPSGLSTRTDSVVIRNAAASQATWTLPGSVTAGASFTAQVAIFDQYGNAFETGSRSVSVRDDSGTLSASSLSLNSSGEGSATLSLTESGTRTLTASSSGKDLGSGTLSVDADTAVALEIDLSSPWVWVDEPQSVEVGGVDQYGNRVAGFADTVTVSSEQGLFTDQVLTSFSGGASEVELSWDSTGLQDRVLLSAATGLSGVSGKLDAVDSCAFGPNAVLTLGGVSQDAVSCLSSGVASATADLAGSSAGDSAIAALHLSDGRGASSRGPSTSRVLTSSDSGNQLVELLVVDSLGCAATESLRWYVADTGVPAGPISVTAADAVRSAGGASASADTTFTLSAVDCTGASISTGSVLVRSDFGSLSGASAGTDGLELDLSVGGLGWSASALEQNGTATVLVGTADGSAFGSTSIEVEGESTGPQVTWMDPRGSTSETLSEITVGFNEDILPSSVDASVTLTGPDGELDWTSTVVGSLLTLTLDQSLDASAGSYELVLDSTLSDSSGNALRGDWSGSAASYSGLFGAVSDAGILVSSCSVSGSTFQPDGDAGTGAASDSVDLSASASSTPDFWILQVYSGEGALIYTETQSASASSATLGWAGQDKDGVIVAPGTYSLHASTLDGNDNLSDSCVQYVTLTQSLVSPSE